MKRFYYIDKNEKEQIDLIELLDYALDYKVKYDDLVIALGKLQKYIDIKQKDDQKN